jgi:hypothetical protein
MPISDLKSSAQQAGGMVRLRTPDSVAGRSQKGGKREFNGKSVSVGIAE